VQDDIRPLVDTGCKEKQEIKLGHRGSPVYLNRLKKRNSKTKRGQDSKSSGQHEFVGSRHLPGPTYPASNSLLFPHLTGDINLLHTPVDVCK
jgi:hypothetical protein